MSKRKETEMQKEGSQTNFGVATSERIKSLKPEQKLSSWVAN